MGERLNSVRVRPMRLTDAGAVAALSGQLGYPAAKDQIERRFTAILGGRDGHVFVAEGLGGAVLGWAHVFAVSLLESEGQAELGGLVVDSGSHGLGIGKALVDAAETWAVQRGFTAMAVRSNVIRTGAHEFYKRLGYTILKSQFKFVKPLS